MPAVERQEERPGRWVQEEPARAVKKDTTDHRDPHDAKTSGFFQLTR